MEPMAEDERRAFLTEGTRTGKVAWVGASSGRPHVAPIWFVLDGDDLVFTTHEESAKGAALKSDPHVSVVVDDERPPFAYVKLDGPVELSEDPDALLDFATRIGGRYMGADRAEEFGRRNGVPGELLVRLRPASITALRGIAD